MNCPKCGAGEVDAYTPWTMYGCGSRDYDQRPGTFKQGLSCQLATVTAQRDKLLEALKAIAYIKPALSQNEYQCEVLVYPVLCNPFKIACEAIEEEKRNGK